MSNHEVKFPLDEVRRPERKIAASVLQKEQHRHAIVGQLNEYSIVSLSLSLSRPVDVEARATRTNFGAALLPNAAPTRPATQAEEDVEVVMQSVTNTQIHHLRCTNELG